MGYNNKKKNKNNKNNKRNKLKKEAPIKSAESNENETDDNIHENDDVEHEPVAQKRKRIDDDSDAEEKPRKKKKKQIIPTETSDKKGKKSIRQMKKEKYIERKAEAELAAKDQLKSQCVTYLSQWKHDRDNWKFMKAKQVWLYKNMFSTNLVPELSWPVLLEYFEGAKGNIRNMLLENANKVIKQMDDWTESQSKSNKMDENDEEGTDETSIQKPEDSAYKRARDLIQCLAE